MSHSIAILAGSRTQCESFEGVCLREIVLDSPPYPMIFSKEYVGYLGRKSVEHLIEAKMIKTEHFALVQERIAAAIQTELMLEDQINEEVRVILDAIQDEMRRNGAEYGEMFKKVKQQLVRKYKAIL